MSEYKAPGVFIEEGSFRPKSIEGVSTATTGFAGPTQAHPGDIAPPLLTSLADFERAYGRVSSSVDFMWHAVRAFFAEGGRRLYVSRVHATDGAQASAKSYEAALASLEKIEDISIVAAPGSTYGYEGATYGAESRAIVNALVSHAERMRYRIALLDSGDGQSTGQVRAMRATLDSSYAALYYPWVRIRDPLTRREIALPPSGFVAGIYARTDELRGVHKAPANEVVKLATGFERAVSKAEQDTLNPEGINCFRTFEGRGMRLWGARTISSDPEWKYVNMRRYLAYLERSIDQGTQWAVFEPNGERLWALVRGAIEDFLLSEWRHGALLGTKPDQAYFVRCDRTTMTQADIDSGRLACVIGVAPMKPVEFVILRLGQWTADHNA